MAKKDKPPPSQEAQAAEQVEIASMAEALNDWDGYVQSRAATLWSNNALPFELSLEEQLFVRSYIIDRNEVAALTRIGQDASVSVLKSRAKKLLSKAEVQNAVDYLAKDMMDRLAVTAEKVQARVAAVAFFDPRQIMEFDQFGIQMLNSRFWTADQAAAIKKIKMGQNGVEIELYDGLKAAEMLAKQIGLQSDDTDAAEQARQGADEALRRIFGVFDKVVNDTPTEPIEPKRVN